MVFYTLFILLKRLIGDDETDAESWAILRGDIVTEEILETIEGA